MHAIVRQGNGNYYVSPVFGFLKGSYSYYYVWDSDKSRILKLSTFEQNNRYLIPQMLIVDSDRSDWIIDEDGAGSVDILSIDLLEDIVCMNEQPNEVIQQCKSIDKDYVYDEYPEIVDQKSVDDLIWVSGGFHDAYIAKEELMDDDTLYILFEGTWGCKIEVWFWGDLVYDTSSRNPDTCDPYWFDSTIIMENGFIYLIDDECMTVDKICPEYCYFKARHMKYHIIPD